MVKAQLSIDYIIVFSFVLIIFILIFGLVATQRVQQSQQQNYAQLQVIAQTIAQDINTASALGNGYAQNVSLPSGTGLVSYNLSITSSGTVIVYDNATGRLAYAYAYAPVGRIISSQQYISPNAIHTYNIPIASGLAYMQNSHGDICIDYVCNTTSAQASGLNVYTKVAHAARMNGQSSYIYVANSPSLLQPFIYNAITMSAWVYIKGPSAGSANIPVVNYGTSGQGSYCLGPTIYASPIRQGNTVNLGLYGGFQNTNHGSSTIGPILIKNDTWYFIAWTYSANTLIPGLLTLYVNGTAVANCCVSFPLDPASDMYNLVIGSSAYTYNSGQGACGGSSDTLNGSVSNLQIYSTVLNASQISQLENEGINGRPINSRNLSGWWPLNGNANDYSGNGNNGRAYSVVYPTVAQIYANVTNSTLSPVKGDLVGFSSTLGNFQGNSQVASDFTNSNGIATAFLMQANSIGYATVKVTPFEGNAYTAGNLSGWWPLNTNQGNVIFNFANASDPGTLEGGYWNNVNYAGLFSGYDSYVAVPNSTAVELYNQPMTISFWVSPAQSQNFESVVFKPNEYNVCIGDGKIELEGGAVGSGSTYPYNLSDNRWYNIVLTTSTPSFFGSVAQNLYVNGQLAYGPSITIWQTGPNNSDMIIGSNNQSSGSPSCQGAAPFKGKMANVQLYSTELSSGQVQLLYSEGIGGSPITGSANNGGWWPLNGNTNDYSGNGGNGYGVGSFSFAAAGSAQESLNNAGSFLSTGFNGHDSMVTVNTINNYADILTTGSFTVTEWINMAGTCLGTQSIASDLSPVAGFQFNGCSYSSIFFGGNGDVLDIAGQTVQWPLQVTSGFFFGLPKSVNFPSDTWEMVTAEYNGTTGQADIYLNNRLFAANVLSPHLNLSQSVPFEIGDSYSSGGADAFGGSMANVQLYSTALSATDIGLLYNSGLYGMPRPNDGIVGWWPLNGNANDYSGNGNNGVESYTTYEYTVNTSEIPPLDGYGVSSLGSRNTIIADSSNYQNFSIASWIYLDQPVSCTGVYLNTPEGSGYGLFRNFSAQGFLVGNGGAISNNVTTFPIGKWTYVVGTSDGKNVSYYVDGLLLAKGTTSIRPPGPRPPGPPPPACQPPPPPPPSSGSAVIAGPNLAGSIANIEYYNASLTPGQVYQLYNNQLPITYTEQIPLSWGT